MADFYTFDEVARILSISRPTLLSMIKQKKIKAVKLGRVWRIPKAEIERLKQGE